MNPFLQCTVARPLDHPSEPAQRWVRRAASIGCAGGRAGAPRRSRKGGFSGWLGAAGLVALTWSGNALGVDLNTATAAQLQAVRGIGSKTAQIIVDERARAGTYTSFNDLSDRVRGIGPRRAQALQSAGLTIASVPAASKGLVSTATKTPRKP